MKKFLSMLLALSVVFTYTFGAAGSVFATEPVEDATAPKTVAEKINAAKAEVVKEAKDAVAAKKLTLKAEYKETFGTAKQKAVLTKADYENTLNQIEKDLLSIIDEAVEAKMVEVKKGTSTYTDSTLVSTIVTDLKDVTVNDLIVKEDAPMAVTYAIVYSAIANVVAAAPTTDIDKHYAMFTWNNALDTMKNQVKAEYAKLDLGLYTNDVAPSDADIFGAAGNPYKKTWNGLATEKKAELIKAIDDVKIDMIGDSYTKVTDALEVMFKSVEENLKAVDSVTNIDGVTVVYTYVLKDSNYKTKDDLKSDAVKDEASKKELLALVAAKVAEASKTAVTTFEASSKDADAKKAYNTALEQIAAWETVFTYGVNEELDYAKTATLINNSKVAQNKWVTITDLYAKYVATADILKATVEKDGSLRYDAKKIDKNLETAKKAIFAENSAYTAANAADKLSTGALVAADTFAWDKEVALAAVNKEMKETLYNTKGEDLFYAPEKTKMEAEYKKVIDKITEATTSAQLTAANVKTSGRYVAANACDNKEAVVNNLKLYSVVISDFIGKVNAYIANLNFGLKVIDDAYRAEVATTGDDLTAVAKFLAENGARTKTDVTGMMAKAKDFATSRPTNGEVKTLTKAAEDAVKAIPAVVTLADKATVVAAYEAVDKAGMAKPARLTNAIAAVQAAEKKAVAELQKAIPATVTVADKAAVKAFRDAAEAYAKTEMYASATEFETAAEAAFKAVRAAEQKDVIAAITALTDDSTKEQVEAVRAKVDAFVAEYRDAEANYNATDLVGATNLDKLIVAEARIKAQEEANKYTDKDAKADLLDMARKVTIWRTSKKSIRVTAVGSVSNIKENGYTVKYTFYKKAPGAKAFKAVKTTTSNKFVYKNLKKGTNKFQVKVKVYDAEGKLVASKTTFYKAAKVK